MSNDKEWYEDDDDTFEDSDSGLSNLRKADRAKAKRIKELEDELEGLRKFQRESVVSSVLKEKGVNPNIAKYIPSDASTSAELVEKWLDENGADFGYTKQTAEATTESQINSEDLAALRQIDMVANNSVSAEDVSDLMSRVNNAQSMDELLNLINGS